jgi:hypothetical protein
MKMQLKDIVIGHKMATRLKVLEMNKYRDTDPTAEIYRKVRDAAFYTGDVPAATRIAVLELVKAELVRNLQSQIDEGME